MSLNNVAIRFAGQDLQLDPEGVLYWPSEHTLIASDLHFEKSTFLAQHGSLVPPYDTHDTLERLERLVKKYKPKKLILLGDSFHDRSAWKRLDVALQKRITALAKTVPCVWLEGNHDVALAGHELGDFAAQHQVAGILFTHEPAKDIEGPQIIGHYHPKIRLTLRAAKVSGRCFVHTDRMFVMPSFGSYTGGLDVRDEAFNQVLEGSEPELYMIHGTHVHRIMLRPKVKKRV